MWDLHYPRPAVLRFSYPISAIVRNTPVRPAGPWVLPGRYTVRLTVDGDSYTQPLTVKMDPRVRTSAAEIRRQHEISLRLYGLLQQDFDTLAEVRAFSARTRDAARQRDAVELESTLVRINGALGSLYRIVEESDVGPTSQVVEAIGNQERVLAETLARWQAVGASRN